MELTIKRFRDLSLDELYEILRARVKVFVIEQNCPYQELDGRDQYAWHVFFHDESGIVAYLRVIDGGIQCPSVAIGRVITLRRGEGLGLKVLKEGIRVAKEKLNANEIEIEAQVYAKGFYEKVGFRQSSEEFLEDGIPHMRMTLKL